MNLSQNIILADHTTFKIGGPAKFFIESEKEKEVVEALKFAQKENLDFFILGKGSNILVSDNGFPGLVIKLNDSRISVDQNKINCAAGLMLAELVNKSYQNGLAGFEWAAGIPGTVGGAIFGNAGAYGSSIGDSLYSVEVIYIAPSTWKRNIMLRDMIMGKINDQDDISQQISTSPQGDIYHLKLFQKECDFSYRESLFSNNRGFIILSSIFLLKPEKKEVIKENMDKIIKSRVAKIPGFPSAGSFFKNPKVSPEMIKKFETDTGQRSRGGIVPAGWLIEEASLKGKKIGEAMVSEEHANFIINTGKATAEHVIMLSSYIKQQVRDKFGVELREEIKMLGF